VESKVSLANGRAIGTVLRLSVVCL